MSQKPDNICADTQAIALTEVRGENDFPLRPCGVTWQKELNRDFL